MAQKDEQDDGNGKVDVEVGSGNPPKKIMWWVKWQIMF